MIEVCAQQGWSVERRITKEHAKESQNVLTKNILKGGKVIQECLDNVAKEMGLDRAPIEF